MKISQDVRDFAREEVKKQEEEMQKKAQEFKDLGSEIYNEV